MTVSGRRWVGRDLRLVREEEDLSVTRGLVEGNKMKLVNTDIGLCVSRGCVGLVG